MTARQYHQFLGNGIDALLLGPAGCMVPSAAEDLDRCYWYKADVYYADSRSFEAGDDPAAYMASAPGGTSFQLAPLARTWYEVLDHAGEPLPIGESKQHFDPQTGLLHSLATVASAQVRVRSWLAPDRPAMHIELEVPDELSVRALAAPGLWPEDIEQIDPVDSLVALPDEPATVRFSVGDTLCTLALIPAHGSLVIARGGADHGVGLHLRGRKLAWWTVLESSRYPEEAGTRHHLPSAPGDYTTPLPPAIEIPDVQFASMHQFSIYMFRAMQHRHSGGLPVNNLRRTFNSHVFWDGAFVQRTLLEVGQVSAAREAWRFLGRTREAAAANAQRTFGARGLHWDWEVTHEGKRAYLPWVQQRFQIHNTPLLAHMIFADFRATRDKSVLAEGYELLYGAAEFVLQAALVDEDGRLATRPLVGSHEAAERVVNDGATVAACMRVLSDLAIAARLLGREDDLAKRAAAASHRLRPVLDSLFNGRYLQASRDEDRLNTSSLTPIYPADALRACDPRARATAAAYLARYAGRLAGHGNNEDGFPWSAGLLARILAYQGDAAAAWEQLQLSRSALCTPGGCAEYVGADGRWNNQYFSTAQAALCSALHALLLQEHGGELRLFPALPPEWDQCAFHGFLFGGISIDAAYHSGHAGVRVTNHTSYPRRITLRLGAASRVVTLGSGDHQELEMEKHHGQRHI